MSVSHSPLVSVVVPAHNAATTLARALNSIRIQTYHPIEVIVVDDASGDATAEVAAGFSGWGVTLVRSSTCVGAAGARNLGIEASRGDFIAFLDADDEWLPGKLDRQMAELLADSAMTFVSCDSRLYDIDNHDIGPLYPGRPPVSGRDIWRVLLAYNFIATPSVVLRRSALDSVGLFDTSLLVGEDQDMWIRLAMAGTVGYVHETLVRVFDMPNSLSARNFNDQLSYTMPMIRRHIDAKRAEMSRRELRWILGVRLGRIGRAALGQKRLAKGTLLVAQALWLGDPPRENIHYLLTSILPIRAVKRFLLRLSGNAAPG